MSRDVAERIRRRIRQNGPITFAEFMDDALYGPGGFYATTTVGTHGHFVTSPHVHPQFSRLVGAALEQMWVLLGRPAPLRIVEVGAGDGTMAREIVAGFERAGIDLEYAAVDVSPAARTALSSITPTVAETLDELAPLDPGLVVANELLDNLPFRRVRDRGGELVEIRIGLDDDDSFVEVEAALDGEVPFDDEPTILDRDEAILPTAALAFVDELSRSVRHGYALLIDYASDSGATDRVHGYRDHRLLADVLHEPGSADITAGVDLDAVARHARTLGLEAFETVAQRDALIALGLDEWLRGELEHQRELVETSNSAEAVRTWGGRSRARLLADPAGLGRLRWLVLATHGLPEPPWLQGAGTDRQSPD